MQAIFCDHKCHFKAFAAISDPQSENTTCWRDTKPVALKYYWKKYKVAVHAMSTHGGVEVYLHVFFISLQDGNGELHDPAVL
jgi:hypothetical protein